MYGNGTAKELMSTFSPLDPTKRDESKVIELTIIVRVSESCYLTIRGEGEWAIDPWFLRAKSLIVLVSPK